MTSLKGAAALLLLASALPAHAADSINGRWAADPQACGMVGAGPAQSPLIVTGSAVRWHDDACPIARVYKTGSAVHIQALCWSFAGECSVPVSLTPNAGKLSVSWDRVRRAELRRCQ